MSDPVQQPTIVEILRGRILGGVRAGTLRPGDRLPSARELVGEFGVDHRLILASYRQLADEGLVEIQERGGVYVASAPAGAPQPALLLPWLADCLAEGYARELGGPELTTWLRRATETVRLHAIVVSSTRDQVSGLARELREDFGLQADGIIASGVDDEEPPSLCRQADVIFTTSAHVELVERLAKRLRKPWMRIDVRPDLVAGEWALLLRQPVWAIVATAEFGRMLTDFFGDVKGAENLHVLVHGDDDLAQIPEGAPTYVTQRVRESLSLTTIRGRVLPPARTIAVSSAREIFLFIARTNLAAAQAVADAAALPARTKTD